MKTSLKIILFSALCASAGCWRACIYQPTHIGDAALRTIVSDPLGRWEEVRLQVPQDNATIVLSGLLRPAQSSPESVAPTLLFFGGNAMSIESNYRVAEVMAADKDNWGLAVFSYRGYDLSAGHPSEATLVSDGVTIADYLCNSRGVATERLFIIGQSLGTGVAAQVATLLEERQEKPAGLILLSPYTALSDVVDDMVPLLPLGWSVSDEFNTHEVLTTSTLSILAIHGVHDHVISVNHGRALKAALGQRFQLVEVNRGHNDLWSRPSPVVVPVQRFIMQHLSAPPSPQ